MSSNLEVGPLWPIVHRVVGTDEEARRKKVESERTRLCILGGLHQLERMFSEPLVQVKETSGPIPCRSGQMVSYNGVAEAVNRLWNPVKAMTVRTFSSTWARHGDFLADLLSIALYRAHWSLHIAKNPEVVERLKTAEDFAGAVRETALLVQQAAFNSDLHRLHLYAAVYADADPVIRDALRNAYRLAESEWARLYKEVLAARGQRLRPDLSFAQFARMLNCVDLGIAGRAWGDPDTDFGDTAKESTLGDIVSRLIPGCIDMGDGSDVDSLINDKFRLGEE
ncbi:hypothetical protein [Streptomyces albidus (ex Kaewkla and Franco 2022)]|uniref:hypothetical protein n=1 Tax=Streptomyces albidus (ex Kaewkla and Franco 2022) TaxID=722709 RepID=UPI0015EE655F|nr:hypothetical protein [Streptomyces albidus (ex Kaewkla and Franco 2022)]